MRGSFKTVHISYNHKKYLIHDLSQLFHNVYIQYKDDKYDE